MGTSLVVRRGVATHFDSGDTRHLEICLSMTRYVSITLSKLLMQIRSDNFADGQPIPAANAFGKPGAPVALSDNRSPHLAWRDAPADLPRVEFVHWLMANIPAECGEFDEGACCDGITPRGKRDPLGPPG